MIAMERVNSYTYQKHYKSIKLVEFGILRELIARAKILNILNIKSSFVNIHEEKAVI